LFSTHPPINERIMAIDPDFDLEAAAKRQPVAAETAGTPPLASPPSNQQLSEALGIGAAQFINQATQPEHLAVAAEIHQALPRELLQAGREIFGGKALIYGLLMGNEDKLRQLQLAVLDANGENAVAAEITKLDSALQGLDANRRFALVNLAIPTLRRLAPAQYTVFIRTVDQLIAADQEINLFEFTLKKILHHQLDGFFQQTPPARTKYFNLLPLLPSATSLIANLAYSGSADPAEVADAFAKGTAQLNISGQNFVLPGEEVHNLDSFDQALDEVSLATPLIRRNILYACATAVMADNQALPEEIEVLRAVAAVLDCPIPPFVGKI
jgi:hypothetical protein